MINYELHDINKKFNFGRKMEKKYKVSGISNQKLENESTISQDVTYKETQAQVEAHDMKLDEKPSDSSQQ